MRVCWVILCLTAAILVFAYLLPQDYRRTSRSYLMLARTAFMVRTFIFHIGLGLLMIVLAAAVLRRWKLFAISATLAILCTAQDLKNFLPRSTTTIAGESLSVMSVNLLGANRQTDAMIAEIRAADADVLVLVEYREHWHAALSAALAGEYPYRQHTPRGDNFGLAIYSRRPFIEPTNLALSIGAFETPQARTVIELNGQPVAIYAVHLAPPSDLRWSAMQRQETADLLDLLREEKLPHLACGDFNFTNTCTFAADLRALGLRDTHDLAGYGRGTTWPDLGLIRFAPGIRIDHIYLSSELTATQATVGQGPGSDHKPVTAKIGFKQ